MATRKRKPAQRTTLGLYPSAALPAVWWEKDRRGLSFTKLAAALDGMNPSTVVHLLYGDHSAGRAVAATIHRILGVDPTLWGEPCPTGWRPHKRKRPPAAA